LGTCKNDAVKVERIQIKTLKNDIKMVRQELEEANKQKADIEARLEQLRYTLIHVKEDNIKELEKKYKEEIKEMKHMIYLLRSNKAKTSGDVRAVQLEKECEALHCDNYKLSQEIQYLEFKLKVVLR